MTSPQRTVHYPIARYFAAALLFGAFAIGAIWRFSAWHNRFGVEALVHWGTELQGHPWIFPIILVVYVIAGLMVFLHAALLWATALTFDPLHAFLYAEAGSLASALAVYGLGRVLRQDVVDRLTGTYADRLARSLAHRAVLSLMILHWFPVAPFSVVNLVSGSTHVRFGDYVIGTIAGMTPGILVVCFFGHQLVHVVRHPHWINFLELGLFAAIGWVALRQLHKVINAHNPPIT